METLELLSTTGGNTNGAASVERGTVVSQEIKYRITIWASNSISGYEPEMN